MPKRYYKRRYKYSRRYNRSDVSYPAMLFGSIFLISIFWDYIKAFLGLLIVAGLLWITWKTIQWCVHIIQEYKKYKTPFQSEVQVDHSGFENESSINLIPKPQRPPIPKSIRAQVLKRDGFKCVWCGRSGKEIPLEVDHILPWSKGGKHELNNLQTLCRDCNRGKSNRFTG